MKILQIYDIAYDRKFARHPGVIKEGPNTNGEYLLWWPDKKESKWIDPDNLYKMNGDVFDHAELCCYYSIEILREIIRKASQNDRDALMWLLKTPKDQRLDKISGVLRDIEEAN